MLLKNNINEDEEIVLLPDNITISGEESYETTVNRKLSAIGKNIWGTHRLDSHSSLFIQMADVLTGAVLYDMRGLVHSEKEKVTNKVREKINVKSLARKTTKTSPNYFSVWIYEK